MGAPDGNDLGRAFSESTRCLERYRDSINALNVFPVPDGDTGTNMLLTLRAALDRLPEPPGDSAAQVASALADGAFWGARGNSGVILSQLFRGLAQALQGQHRCDGPCLARGLDLATAAAYQSVAQPVEGTMLTVLRSASEAAHDRVASFPEADANTIWEAAFQAATEAMYRTPSQLAVLQDAGVVDAGGMGIVVVLGGALCSLTGQDPATIDQAVAECCVEPNYVTGTSHSINSGYLDSTLESQWGYCIQFLIGETKIPVDQVRQGLGSELGESAVVVGDGSNIRVHVHAPDPGPALGYGASLGELFQIEIENMGQQNTEFVAGHRARNRAPTELAVVAVTQGEGLAQLFQDMGCAQVVSGGQTMNPSVGHILRAVEATGAREVIVLPNNLNVVATAELSASDNPSIHVVPSRTVPQGVAALLAFNPEEPLVANLKTMTSAVSTVVTVEVTRAVRSATISGEVIPVGRYISLLDGELDSSGDSPETVLKSSLDRTLNSADQVVTLYRGLEASVEAAEELLRRLEQETPGLQVELVHGGQPNYHYLASVE